MGYISILAEKPSQAKAYSQAYDVEKRDKSSITLKPCETFKNGAVITWGIGHLVELKMPADYDEKYKYWNIKNLPIIPEKFDYKVSKDKRTHFDSVAKILRGSSEIYIATDIDREGESIARLIINQAKANDKPIKRLWINSLEIDEIRKGFNNLKDGKETYNLFIEAQSRQMADWLVGMNLSQFFSLTLQEKGFKGSLSIGRVQTPSVVLINERQKEIADFVSKPFYQIEGEFKAENGFYTGIADIKEEKKDVVQELLKKHEIDPSDEGYIQSLNKKEKRTKSPKLHSLSTLQTVANKKWKYSPSDTLKIVQDLYEKKLLSYPRTDCNYITDSEFEYLLANVEDYKKVANVSFETVSTEPKPRYVNSKNVEEHYAIIPTKVIPSKDTVDKLSDKEKNVYEEILINVLGMFHEDYIYEETTVITNVKNLEFKTTGKVEVEKGWKGILKSKEKSNESKEKTLPFLTDKEEVKASVNIKEGFTSPPKPYSEGDLINLMKTCGRLIEDEEDSAILKDVEGIGTEATRASIIDRIKAQGYIEVKKNVVSVTKKGEILCETVKGTLLASPSMTAKWELYLKKIGEGKASQKSFVENTTKFIEKIIEEVPGQMESKKVVENIEESNKLDSVGTCPVCKKGQLNDRKTFYGCSEYEKGCKFSISKNIASKKLTQKNIKDLIEKGATSKIKGFKSKAGKTFEATIIIKEDKVSFKF